MESAENKNRMAKKPTTGFESRSRKDEVPLRGIATCAAGLLGCLERASGKNQIIVCRLKESIEQNGP